MGKKKLFFLSILMTTLTISNRLIAQNPTISLSQSMTYSGIRDYLKDNVLELNPIEGIYAVEYQLIQTSYLYSNPMINYYHGEFAIVNTSDGIKSILLDTENDRLASIASNRDYSFRFRQIVESSIYYCNVVFMGCKHNEEERIRIDRNTFDFTYSITSEREKNCTFSNGAPGGGVNIKMHIIGERIYPTPSMIVQAAQKKQERERKKIEEEASREWTGSGFAIGNGYFVTNYHVAGDAKTMQVKGINGDINTGYTAELVVSDKANDIAIVKITDDNFKGFGTMPYSVSSRMADVGEDVFVLGYPLTQALGNEIKLTNGIISSRTGYQGDISTYQMSAPVQPGNSGGPMFDSKGNVVGIVVAGVPGAENVGYAIKISYLKILIESAGLNITLPTNNTVSTLSLADKVKRLRNFVYYIECSK